MATEIKIKNIPTGYQSGMTPTQLVLAGISMCKVATIRNVARRKNIDIGEVDAELTQVAVKQPDGSYLTEVNSAIKIEGNITEEQKTMLILEADNCYVTKLVKGEWRINNSTPLN